MLKNAANANRCARLLADELLSVEQVKLIHPVDANAVFVQFPIELVDALHAAGWHFYTFIGSGHARFMCSWQTQEEDVRQFGQELRTLAADMCRK